MNWFRSNIKHGSRLALLALALQFGLSFGHFHAGAAQAAAATIEPGATQADVYFGARRRRAVRLSSPPPTMIPTSIRATLAPSASSIALAGTALSATPPVLLLPQAAQFRYLVTDAEFAHLNSGRAAFQPRAPPAS